MAEPKTTWERVRAKLGNLGDYDYGDGTRLRTGLSCAVEFLCDELDASNRRIAELDAQVREMAMGKR